jgi:hypothetical protein
MKNFIPVVDQRVRVRRENLEWIMLSPSGHMIVTNDVGRMIIGLCDGTRTTKDILEILQRSLDGAKGKLDKDFGEFLNELSIVRIVTLVPCQYQAPVLKVRTVSGTKAIGEFDQNVFDMLIRADPPCQSPEA